jgi:hypothetical protein
VLNLDVDLEIEGAARHQELVSKLKQKEDADYNNLCKRWEQAS